MTTDLKKHVLAGKFPTVFTSKPMPDPKTLGVILLSRLIPAMEDMGEFAFAWHWAANDIVSYTKSDYDNETGSYKNVHKMECSKGETVWHYDYTFKGKKRRCILETEIWFKPGKEHNVSPMAMLFCQFMGNGLHITKCRWEDRE